MQRQRRNVVDALAQRRDRQRKDTQAIVEIGPERSVFDHLHQIAVRRRDDPHVHLLGSRAPEPLELTLLQDAQQLGLYFRRNVADLVQEQRAVMRQLEAADPPGRGTGERALLVPEQLALEQAGRHCRHVHPDERLVAPAAQVVDRVRDQLLAGARLAKEQHGAVGWRDGLDGLQHPPQRRARADDLGELVVKLAFEVVLFVDQMRVAIGDFLVGAGILESDGDLRRRLPEQRDVLL